MRFAVSVCGVREPDGDGPSHENRWMIGAPPRHPVDQPQRALSRPAVEGVGVDPGSPQRHAGPLRRAPAQLCGHERGPRIRARCIHPCDPFARRRGCLFRSRREGDGHRAIDRLQTRARRVPRPGRIRRSCRWCGQEQARGPERRSPSRDPAHCPPPRRFSTSLPPSSRNQARCSAPVCNPASHPPWRHHFLSHEASRLPVSSSFAPCVKRAHGPV
ncbi:hypothetical protein CDEF62S_01865 [Castellaniella defragrans]